MVPAWPLPHLHRCPSAITTVYALKAERNLTIEHGLSQLCIETTQTCLQEKKLQSKSFIGVIDFLFFVFETQIPAARTDAS